MSALITSRGRLFGARLARVLVALIASAGSLAHASSPTLREAIEAELPLQQRAILTEYMEILRHVAPSRDLPRVRKSAKLLQRRFAARKVELQALEIDGAAPLLYGTLAGRKRGFTIGVYAHYDVAPIGDDKWTFGAHEPTLVDGRLDKGGRPLAELPPDARIDPDWRVYARGAGDDVVNVAALLPVLDIMRAREQLPDATLKFVLDGEEEMGSPHLAQYRARFADRFDDIDLWLIFDGPAHWSGRPHLVLGARGVVAVDLTVYGAPRPLHSGHYADWAPVPGQQLAELLASMRDADGRVRILGFHDDVAPLDADDRRALAQLAPYDARLRSELGLREISGRSSVSLNERLLSPSLTIRGLKSGDVGQAARTAIPSSATASIEMRLAPGLSPERAVHLLREHVRSERFHLTTGEPTMRDRNEHARFAQLSVVGAAYPGFRARLADPLVRQVRNALAQLSREDVLVQPISGGTLPLAQLLGTKIVPVAVIPTANHDDDQHARDENLRIGNLWYAVRAIGAAVSIEAPTREQDQ